MRNSSAWRNYRDAFEEFSTKARLVQTLREQPTGPGAIETALLDLERSRRVYNGARDQLVRELAPSVAAVSTETAPGNVRGIAQLLWEVAGRPEGTAHQDWLKAEEIARRAAA